MQALCFAFRAGSGGRPLVAGPRDEGPTPVANSFRNEATYCGTTFPTRRRASRQCGPGSRRQRIVRIPRAFEIERGGGQNAVASGAGDDGVVLQDRRAVLVVVRIRALSKDEPPG